MSRYLCRLDLSLPSLGVDDRKLIRAIRAISHVLDSHATFKASLRGQFKKAARYA